MVLQKSTYNFHVITFQISSYAKSAIKMFHSLLSVLSVEGTSFSNSRKDKKY